MPSSLLEAFETDLKQRYMAVKSKENWQAIVSNVILNILQSSYFDADDFPYTSEYVNSKPKLLIIEEIKRHAFRPENILNNVVLSKSAAGGIVYNILELENSIEPDIISVLCNKIDTINANNNFKQNIKQQIKEGTVSDDELRRHRVISEQEIQAYHVYLQSINNSDMGNYSK